jgi:hypothetical protein
MYTRHRPTHARLSARLHESVLGGSGPATSRPASTLSMRAALPSRPSMAAWEHPHPLRQVHGVPSDEAEEEFVAVALHGVHEAAPPVMPAIASLELVASQEQDEEVMPMLNAPHVTEADKLQLIQRPEWRVGEGGGPGDPDCNPMPPHATVHVH